MLYLLWLAFVEMRGKMYKSIYGYRYFKLKMTDTDYPRIIDNNRKQLRPEHTDILTLLVFVNKVQ